MSELNKLNKEISELTIKLKNEKPEVYKLLAENPTTVPNKANEDSMVNELKSYRDNLKQLINKK